ncbi:MAG: hypothetical protein F6K19_20370 [Cyanothece sp. SIO1E1]|nr:hypothetical protein [Cyanothece sp. SIO1E1]
MLPTPKKIRRKSKISSWRWLVGVFLGYALIGFILAIFVAPLWTGGVAMAGAIASTATVNLANAKVKSQSQNQIDQWANLITMAGAITIAIVVAVAINGSTQLSADPSSLTLGYLSWIWFLGLITAVIIAGGIAAWVVATGDRLLTYLKPFQAFTMLAGTAILGLFLGCLVGLPWQ